MSRSTWACELKFVKICKYGWGLWSRSTWACELKFNHYEISTNFIRVTLHVSVWVEMLSEYSSASVKSRHAPRERVSWNIRIKLLKIFKVSHAPRERVSWNASYRNAAAFSCCHAPRERVSWNENVVDMGKQILGHAPRERVSWNCLSRQYNFRYIVTLHVSVWVEILIFFSE